MNKIQLLTPFQQKVHNLLIEYATTVYTGGRKKIVLSQKTAKDYTETLERYLPKEAKNRFGLSFPDTAYDIEDISYLQHIHDIIDENPDWKAYDRVSHGSTLRGGLKCLISMRRDETFLKKHGFQFVFSPEGHGILENKMNVNNFYEGEAYECHCTRFERNKELRDICLSKFGYKCYVCGFDFERVYGEIGKGFIEVHHLQPLSEIRKEHVTDPVNGLRPLCSNCHSMIHRHGLISIEQLQEYVKHLYLDGIQEK